MSKSKSRILIASNSQKNRHHLLGQLVKLNYPTSCMTAAEAINRKSTLRVTRPDIILFDLSDESIGAATSISSSFALHLDCPVLYVINSWDSREYRSLNSGTPGDKICYVSKNATPHELELSIENRILKSIAEGYATARQHEKWSFEAMASALGQPSNLEETLSGVLGILGAALDASCAVVRQDALTGVMHELASSGTRNEHLHHREKRLSHQTMNWIEKFPYLHPQQIKNTKINIDIFDEELLWMPRSAIITNIAPVNAQKTALCTWSEAPRQFSESEIHVASMAAIFLAIACATIDCPTHIATFPGRLTALRAGA